MEDPAIGRFAGRLGSAAPELVGEAASISRLLRLESGARELSDAALSVLALDLACSAAGRDFDSKAALGLSGLRRAAYSGARLAAAKLLGVRPEPRRLEAKSRSLRALESETKRLVDGKVVDDSPPDETEEYETWKERILREAYEEIARRDCSSVFDAGVSLTFASRSKNKRVKI